MLKPMLKKNIQCPEHLVTRSSSTLPTSDWSNLLEDILDEIMKKMCCVDLATFGSVCKSWRLLYVNRLCCLPRKIPLGVPVLYFNAYKLDSNSRKFVKMSGELESDEIFMPEATNKWVCGSSWGWLVLTDKYGTDVSLLNPFTRRVIQLPSFDTSEIIRAVSHDGFSYIIKAILSTNPAISQQDCIIMAIVGSMRTLSYCRIGDKRWTNVEYGLRSLSDVIYYEGKFYVIDVWGILMSCDIIDLNSTEIVSMVTPIYSYFKYCDRKFLVMASGRLLLVSRRWKYRFEVHSLNKRNSSFLVQRPLSFLQIPNKVEIWHKWVKIDSIGDQMLFIGNNSSFALPTQSHSGKANCIYFTEDDFLWPQGYLRNDYIGLYDIAKKSLCITNEHAQDDSTACPQLLRSFWVTPTPW
ncbi:putative F-box protein At5g55150 [Carex rostrata]